MLVELKGGGIYTGGNLMERTPPIVLKMNWSQKNYTIQLENGDRESVAGIANGLFGLSDTGVLTHLATGYRVAAFPNQAAGRAAGDYLASAYAEEFKALNRAFTESITYDGYRALSETADLNAKINADHHYNRLLAAGVRRNEQ